MRWKVYATMDIDVDAVSIQDVSRNLELFGRNLVKVDSGLSCVELINFDVVSVLRENLVNPGVYGKSSVCVDDSAKQPGH